MAGLRWIALVLPSRAEAAGSLRDGWMDGWMRCLSSVEHGSGASSQAAPGELSFCGNFILSLNLLLELWCTKDFPPWPSLTCVCHHEPAGLARHLWSWLSTFGSGSVPLVLTQLQKWQVSLSLKDAAAMLGLEGTSKVNLLFYPSLKLRTSFLLA